MNGLIAAVLSLPVWALVLIAVFAGSTLIWCVIAAGAEHEDGDLIPLNDAAGQRLRAAMQDPADIDRGLAILCDPCNDLGDGDCTCRSRLLCGNDNCPAPDTAVLTGRDVAWLRSLRIGEGGSHG